MKTGTNTETDTELDTTLNPEPTQVSPSPRAPGAALPPARLLAGASGQAPISLSSHRTSFRQPPSAGIDPRYSIIEMVGESGLLGRGGAAFPTARKLKAVAGGPGPRIVVANGTEGEPPSAKDQTIMANNPHLVIDGALLAAAAVGATQVLIGVDRAHRRALETMRAALAERTESESPGIDVRLAGTPSRYVAGEETGLVQWMNGGPAMPTSVPPRPFEKGVSGRPTLVQNVETLAHIALIANRGPAWFRELGTQEEPGTRLVTVSGAVRHPGVVEAPVGTTIATLVEAAGGATSELSALMVGGFYGTWLPAAHIDTPYSRAGLAPLGASPGAGVVVALPASTCGLAETARVVSWYAGESAGQCGPCVFGLADLADLFSCVAAARANRDDLETVRRWAGDIEGRGACKHPDGAVRLVRSALAVFEDELARHMSSGLCRGDGNSVLRVPAPAKTWR